MWMSLRDVSEEYSQSIQSASTGSSLRTLLGCQASATERREGREGTGQKREKTSKRTGEIASMPVNFALEKNAPLSER